MAVKWCGLIERFRENKLPNKDWLLILMHILVPEHEIFEKGYVFKREQGEKIEHVFDNDDGFFDGLP